MPRASTLGDNRTERDRTERTRVGDTVAVTVSPEEAPVRSCAPVLSALTCVLLVASGIGVGIWASTMRL